MQAADIQKVLDATNPRNILPSSCSQFLGEQVLLHKKYVEGKGIIELGSAHTALLPDIFTLDIPFYAGVDPFYSYETRDCISAFLTNFPQLRDKLTAVSEDGLTYLKGQQTGSATIISSGVLASEVIGYKRYGDSLVSEYQTSLASQIYRVTALGGISLHNGIDKRWREALIATGFRNDAEDKSLFWR